MPVGTIQAQLDASHSLSSTRKSSAALLSGKNNVDVSMLSTVKSNRQHSRYVHFNGQQEEIVKLTLNKIAIVSSI